jgi:hypothetical protein
MSTWQGPAANGGGGMSTWQGVPVTGVAACLPRHHLANATATCQVWQRRQGGAGIGPGGTCHVSPGQGVPPLRRGLFWQIFSEVVSFAISLVQVVSSVKNSLYLDLKVNRDMPNRHRGLICSKVKYTGINQSG